MRRFSSGLTDFEYVLPLAFGDDASPAAAAINDDDDDDVSDPSFEVLFST